MVLAPTPARTAPDVDLESQSRRQSQGHLRRDEEFKELSGDIKVESTTASASDSNEVLVDWDGLDDPANPLNWPLRRKTFIIVIVSAVTFNISLAPTIFAPGVPLLLREFSSHSSHSSSSSDINDAGGGGGGENINTALASFAVSAYVVAFAVGPLVFAPLSELYGRNAIMWTSNALFLVFTVVCALAPTVKVFVVFRILQGLAGVVPLVLGGGIIGDLMPPEKRGRALSGWQLGPLLGPVIGPVAGGYIAQDVGWRWLFWVLAILGGVLSLLNLLVPETYHPVLLARKASRLQRQDTSGSVTYIAAGSTRLTKKGLLLKSIVRPLKMMKSPIVLILSLQLGMTYGYLYLLFTTFTFVFEEQYQFRAGAAGLAYLGLGVGFLTSLFFLSMTSDYIAKKQAQADEDGKLKIKPESRLAPLIFGVLFVPVGLFWYGWTAQYKIHWIVPIIGTTFIGIGVNLVWIPVQSYLIDAFTIYAASAIGANTVIRSVFGVVLPLAGQPLYDKLGLGWGNSLLGFVALATVPLTWLLMKHGERIRSHPRFQLDL